MLAKPGLARQAVAPALVGIAAPSHHSRRDHMPEAGLLLQITGSADE